MERLGIYKDWKEQKHKYNGREHRVRSEVEDIERLVEGMLGREQVSIEKIGVWRERVEIWLKWNGKYSARKVERIQRVLELRVGKRVKIVVVRVKKVRRSIGVLYKYARNKVEET